MAAAPSPPASKRRPLLDQAIAALSPGWALAREKARLRLEGMAAQQRLYHAAATSGRNAGWTPLSRSADDEIGEAAGQLRDGARYLEQNNPYVANLIRKMGENMGGMNLKVRSRDKAGRKRVTDAFGRWGKRSAFYGETNFTGQVTQAWRALERDGEVLVVAVIDDGPEPRRLAALPPDQAVAPLRLQVVEIDQVDASRDTFVTGGDADGSRVLRGVRYDRQGRKLGWWLIPNPPGSARGSVKPESIFVPAERVAHLYDPNRPSQSRGVTGMSSGMLTIKDLDLWNEAVLVLMQIKSCLTAWITTDDGERTLSGAKKDASGRLIETFSPGTVNYLAPGESAMVADPGSISGFDEFWYVQLRAFCASRGIPYEVVTGDLSKFNFMSSRYGDIQWQKTLKHRRETILIPQLLDKVWLWWSEASVRTGIFALPVDAQAEWHPDKPVSVQPLDDANEEGIRLRNGTLLPQDALAARGIDWEDFIDQYVEFLDRLEDAREGGIPFDSLPIFSQRTGAPRFTTAPNPGQGDQAAAAPPGGDADGSGDGDAQAPNPPPNGAGELERALLMAAHARGRFVSTGR